MEVGQQLLSMDLFDSKTRYLYWHKRGRGARAGVVQWIEHWPVNQRVASLICSQGTFLGCRPGPRHGAHERQPHTGVSLLLFLSSPLSKNK